MRRSPHLALALSLAFLLPGCLLARTSLNEPLDPARVASLQAGMSSADVVRVLGAPTEVVQLGRKSAYRYDYSKQKRAGLFLLIVGFFNEDTREDRVWAFFDDEGVLTHFGATLEADQVRYAMPWTELHGE